MLSVNYENINNVMTQILKLSCASFSYVNISYVLAFNNYVDRILPFFDPTPSSVNSFYTMSVEKQTFFDPLRPTPSSCPRSYWMSLWTKNVFFSRKDTNVLSCVIHVTAKRILERLGVQTLYCPFFCFKKQEWMQVCMWKSVHFDFFFLLSFNMWTWLNSSVIAKTQNYTLKKYA